MRDKEIVGLHEAYLDVYSNLNEEVENWVNSLIEEGYDLSEYTWDDMYEMYVTEGPNYDKNRQRAAQRAAARNAARKEGKTGNVPGVGYVSPRPEGETYRDSAGVERHTSGAKMPKKEVKEDYSDAFDTILEHLIVEGYADTNESALAIMANMSEEWREEILDEANEIMSITSPEGKRKKVNRTYPSARASQNAQNAKKLGALQKRQRLNPNAMGPRAARRQATDEVETNTRKSIRRLNAAKNIEDRQAEGDYENSIDHSNPSKGKSGYMEVPTDYRARNRRARGR